MKKSSPVHREWGSLQGKLFRRGGRAPRAEEIITVEVDGAARGNPGPAAYGVVFRRQNGTVIERLARVIGEATNNVAEYEGLLAALEFAAKRKFRSLRVHSDSELMVRQIQGTYKVKSAALKPYYERAKALIRKLDHFEIHSVLRERNREADRLANRALDGSLR